MGYQYNQMKRRSSFSISALILTILAVCLSKQCLNSQGEYVDWWLKLIFPSNVPRGYAYFDSTYAAPSFVINENQPDSEYSPMTKTLSQINTLEMNSLAWNDQKPNGTMSSVKAHSKGVLAFDQKTERGFLIVHSMPQYPAFNGFIINTTIGDSQKVYGQHVFCLSVDNLTYYDLITKLLPIRPFFYAENFNNGGSINKLIQNGIVSQPDYVSYFTYRNLIKNEFSFKFIFKNGGVNASIFEDGLNNLLQSPLLAQTWGRPLQQPWCGSQNDVSNILSIRLSQKIFWPQTKDHSKWVYSKTENIACFGDMNRMASQWKRGGAFYCVQSELLKQALVSITQSSKECSKQSQNSIECQEQ